MMPDMPLTQHACVRSSGGRRRSLSMKASKPRSTGISRMNGGGGRCANDIPASGSVTSIIGPSDIGHWRRRDPVERPDGQLLGRSPLDLADPPTIEPAVIAAGADDALPTRSST